MEYEKKDRWTAGLLCFFVGVFGVHQFYVGNMWQGFFQLVTLGALGIWAFVDLIMIITGEFKDARGVKCRDW
jgi:TM2 domain-containing membrane protein YozV